MREALPLRVIVASPGDLADERAAVQACIEEHRRRREGQTGVTYEVVAWDQVRGTARRPQEAINELIAECHFMIVLFKRSWGNEPGSPWVTPQGRRRSLSRGYLISVSLTGRCAPCG